MEDSKENMVFYSQSKSETVLLKGVKQCCIHGSLFSGFLRTLLWTLLQSNWMGTSSCDINYMEIEHMHMSYKQTIEDKVILLLFLKVFVNNPSLNTIKIIRWWYLTMKI